MESEAVLISNDAIFIVSIILFAIGGIGYIFKKSVINSIHEGFKNESWEKKKRWELKQEIYFSLLESLYRLVILSNALKRQKKEPNSIMAKDTFQRFIEEIEKITPKAAISSLILNDKSCNELDDLISKLKEATMLKSDDIYKTIIEASETAYIKIKNIAKADLKIESPL